ncbi:hypothetical protein H6501_02180 [Candidatus Woesearchaeota archaeon]|nr:hypothetical protein [Nanoarchaeota archaeon]MCB9370382.1 hypothetical protein [Candidatus Woesearchaeota archaeon]
MQRKKSAQIGLERFFSGKNLSYAVVFETLNKLFPLLIKKISTCPAYVFIFQKHNLQFSQFKTFSDFNLHFPVITPEEYQEVINSIDPRTGKKIGPEGFVPESSKIEDLLLLKQEEKINSKEPRRIYISKEDVIAENISLLSIVSSFSLLDLQQKSNEDFYTEISSFSGLFPLAYKNSVSFFPHLIYAIDRDGRLTWENGTLVLNTFFSVKEKAFGKFSILKSQLELIMNNKEEYEQEWNFFPKELRKRMEKILGKKIPLELTLEQFYREVLEQYLKKELSVSVPKGSIFLKFALPVTAHLTKKGDILDIEKIPNTHALEKGKIFILRHLHNPVEYELPFLKNIVCSGKIDSPVKLRTRDIFEGKKKDSEEKCYLYEQSSISKKDLDKALIWDKERETPTELLTIRQISDLLQVLIKKLEKDRTFQEIFSKKSGFPIREVREEIKKTKSFISETNLTSLFLKSFEEFGDETQRFKKLKSLSPLSPFFITTAGNINFLDWFKIFAELLLSSLCGKKITFVIRPSESDILSSYCLYYLQESAKKAKIDYLKTGLLEMFERTFWNPNTHNYALDIFSRTKGSISFGTARTFSSSRLEAVLKLLTENSFPQNEIKKIEEVFTNEKNSKNMIIFNEEKVLELYSKRQISEEIKTFILTFLKRNILYQETLSCGIVTEDEKNNLRDIASQCVEKCYRLHATDCLSLQTLFVHKNFSEELIKEIRRKAESLLCTTLLDEKNQLPFYEKDILKSFFTKSKKLKIQTILPRKETGEVWSFDELIENNSIGISYSFLRNVQEQEFKTSITFKKKVPYLAIIEYGSKEELFSYLQKNLSIYREETGYERYTYIALFGDKLEFSEKEELSKISDKLTQGTLCFNPIEPHNSRFFLRDIFGLGPVK